ncbi:MAG: hypothetical protein RR085_09065, partial [Clostridia bacterium]
MASKLCFVCHGQGDNRRPRQIMLLPTLALTPPRPKSPKAQEATFLRLFKPMLLTEIPPFTLFPALP